MVHKILKLQAETSAEVLHPHYFNLSLNYDTPQTGMCEFLPIKLVLSKV